MEHHRTVKASFWKLRLCRVCFPSSSKYQFAENSKTFSLFTELLHEGEQERRKAGRKEQWALPYPCSWFILYNACCVTAHLAHHALAKISYKRLLREKKEQEKHVQYTPLIHFQPSVISSSGSFSIRYISPAFIISSKKLVAAFLFTPSASDAELDSHMAVGLYFTCTYSAFHLPFCLHVKAKCEVWWRFSASLTTINNLGPFKFCLCHFEWLIYAHL